MRATRKQNSALFTPPSLSISHLCHSDMIRQKLTVFIFYFLLHINVIEEIQEKSCTQMKRTKPIKLTVAGESKKVKLKSSNWGCRLGGKRLAGMIPALFALPQAGREEGF